MEFEKKILIFFIILLFIGNLFLFLNTQTIEDNQKDRLKSSFISVSKSSIEQEKIKALETNDLLYLKDIGYFESLNPTDLESGIAYNVFSNYLPVIAIFSLKPGEIDFDYVKIEQKYTPSSTINAGISKEISDISGLKLDNEKIKATLTKYLLGLAEINRLELESNQNLPIEDKETIAKKISIIKTTLEGENYLNRLLEAQLVDIALEN